MSGPTQAQAGQSLTFDAQSSTSAAPLNSIQWNFGDGTTDSGNLVVNHAYQNPGTYTVLLTLVNDLGQNNAASQQIDIKAAPRPISRRSRPFRLQIQTRRWARMLPLMPAPPPPAAISGYDWDFSDGTTGSGQLASHTLSTWPGTYQVTLTVTDQNGLSGSATAPN
ncbi:MAG: PKD domain-containing protein [Anaerolineae bacterium]